MPHRWCVCGAARPIASPLHVDVVMHFRERHRPSSTGLLINRLLEGSRQFIWRREAPPKLDAVRLPGREIWILHPQGEPMPSSARPEAVQAILLDGAWTETNDMAKDLSTWGRRISLPMTGRSRYWLRDQQEGARFSTVEALIFLLEALQLTDQAAMLRAQFELHVYASLRARGRKVAAEEFLAESPAAAAFPEVLEQLHTRRPL